MTDTQTSEQANDESPTISIENIEILQCIGEGAAGTVYQGYHKAMGTPVAVKLLKRSKTGSAKQESNAFLRFRNEARLAHQLSHPNIVRVLSLGMLPDKQPYIVMELLPGKSLRSILQEADMPVPLAIETFKQICAGMQHAHSHQIIHRDLKPDNVIVSYENGRVSSVKITDFGIAKMQADGDETEQQRLTRTGAILGTPMFMSPEHFNSADPDARSDIYSLGCILYQLLTGKPPFAADSTYELMQKHFKETPEPPSKLRTFKKEYEPLDYIAGKCLAKLPKERYQSCSELLSDIADMEARSFSRQKTRATTTYKKHKLPKKPQSKLIFSLFGLLVLIIGPMGAFLYNKNSRPDLIASSAGSIRLGLWQEAQKDLAHKDWGRAKHELVEFVEQTTKYWNKPDIRVPDGYDPSLDVPRVVSAGEYTDLCSKNWSRWDKQPWYDMSNFLIMVSEQHIAGDQFPADIVPRLQKKIASIKAESDVRENDPTDFRKHLALAAELDMASAAITYYYGHRPTDALQFLQDGDELLTLAHKFGHVDEISRLPVMRADILQSMGVNELENGNYDQAYQYLQLAIDNYRRGRANQFTPAAYGLMGCAQYMAGRRPEALDRFAHSPFMTVQSSGADRSAVGWNRLRMWVATLPLKAYAHLNAGDLKDTENLCGQLELMYRSQPNTEMSALALRGLIDEKNHKTSEAKEKYRQATEKLKALALASERTTPLSALEAAVPYYCADRYVRILELENKQIAAKTGEELDQAIKSRPQLWNCLQRFKKQMLSH